MLRNNFSKFILESGTDEAGRGCLAGPVTAAAVITPSGPKEGTPIGFEKIFYELINDSKIL
jgi:ribonuclease HII